MSAPPPGRAILSTSPVPAPPARRGARLVMSLVLLALLAALGWRGWLWWQSREAGADAAARAQSEQWLALDARLDSLRRDQRAQSQRMAQAEAGARILREEVLGVGQRTALLQDSIDQLAGPARQGAIALRLDEVELLLSQGIQRLRLAGDLDSAIEAYALAAGLLEGIQDPALLDLRQALAQERAALDALGEDPRVVALARLDDFARSLAPPGDSRVARPIAAHRDAHWWQRALSRLVQVQPSDRNVAASPGERAAGYAALQLELSLARSAAERRDEQAWRGALQRASDWQARLWAARDAGPRQAALARLKAMPLQLDLPRLGSTLRQLQAQRRAS